MKESTLHAQLKHWYARPGDHLEEPVDGYLIDIVRDDLLIEIQTRNFSAIKSKLEQLLEKHPVRIVHPIALEKWIIRKERGARTNITRRKSPRRGRIEDLFFQLIRFPHFVTHPNFSLEVLLTQEEEIRVNDGKGSWRRRGWSIHDRRIIRVVDNHILQGAKDYLIFIPDDLPEEFNTHEFAVASDLPKHLAYKMVYCLRKMTLLEKTRKQARSYLYKRSKFDSI